MITRAASSKVALWRVLVNSIKVNWKWIIRAYNLLIIDITNPLIHRIIIIKLLIKCNLTNKELSTLIRIKCSSQAFRTNRWPWATPTSRCLTSSTWEWTSRWAECQIKWVSTINRFTQITFTRHKVCIRMLTNNRCKCRLSSRCPCTNTSNTTCTTKEWVILSRVAAICRRMLSKTWWTLVAKWVNLTKDFKITVASNSTNFLSTCSPIRWTPTHRCSNRWWVKCSSEWALLSITTPCRETWTTTMKTQVNT